MIQSPIHVVDADGMADGEIGTDVNRIKDAIQEAKEGKGEDRRGQ